MTKVYVKALPRSCSKCDWDYENCNFYLCTARKDRPEMDKEKLNQRDPNCPLKKLNIDGFWGTVYLGEGPNYSVIPNSSKKETL